MRFWSKLFLFCLFLAGTASATYYPFENPTLQLSGFWGTGPKALFAVGTVQSKGIILLTHDGGKVWEKQNITTKTTGLYGIWGSSIQNAFAVGDAGVILHTTDGGASWNPQKSGSSEKLFGVWGTGKEVFVVGSNGVILHSADSGKTWKAQNSNTGVLLYAVWGRSAKEVYAAGREGTLLATTDGGASWSTLKSGTKAHLRAISGGKDSVVVVGEGGAILQSTDGKSFSSRGSGKEKLRAVFRSDQGYLACGEASLLRSTDKGETWTTQKIPAKAGLVGVWESNSTSNAFALDTRGAMLIAEDGKTWKYNVEPP